MSQGEVVTHLQFADDTILFCLAIKEAVVTLKRIVSLLVVIRLECQFSYEFGGGRMFGGCYSVISQ